MADNVTLNAGSGGATLATDEVTRATVVQHVQYVKLMNGTDAAIDVIPGEATNGLDVDVTRLPALPAGANTIGAVNLAQYTPATGRLPVDGSGVTQPVSDGGGSLTVDGTVGVSGTVTVDSELTTADLDTGAGTDTRAVVGVVLAASGGGVLLGTANPLPVSDNGGSLTIDGSVAVSGTVTVDGSGVTQPVSGTVTANAGTGPWPVTDNAGSLTVDNGGTFAVQAAGAAAHDAAVSGGPVLGGAYASAAAPTDVSADGDAVRFWALRNGSQVVNLAAGGALIGATSNALDVNIKSGAGSGGTAMADDAAFTVATTSFTPVGGVVTADSVDSGDGGAFAMLANRQQKVTLYDSAGVELAVGGGTQYTEDAAAAANPVGNALIAIRDDARGGSLTSADGDNVALRGTNAGELYVKHVDALTVNSHAVTNAGTFAVQESGAALTALQLIDNLVLAEDAAAASADPGVQVLTVRQDTIASSTSADGDYQSAKTNSVGALYTSLSHLGANALSTGNGTAGTGCQRVTIASDNTAFSVNATLQASTNTQEVVGDAAHDAAVAGNPNRIAGRARTSNYTAVANDDTADLVCTLNGHQVVQPYAIPENTWSYAAASGGITNTTGVTAKAAAGAGVRNYITHVDVVNGHATVSTDVQIRDGASGTVIWRGFAQAAGGGASVNFDPPLRGTANTLVEVACGTTGTATYFNLTGYIGP